VIPALVDYVVDLSRGTTLGTQHNGTEVRVQTVEHVMAALYGLQIDNCKIELSESEPPVCDGSLWNM
jgi:UDP-3-O-[3-hydroxymyristoyl] N-acetylglucosamine deacetylase/3-hydroxyacyl-[acyl-carrier-protein] dehydratase